MKSPNFIAGKIMEVNGDFSSTPCMSTGGYLMGILYGDIQPILYLPDGFNIYMYIYIVIYIYSDVSCGSSFIPSIKTNAMVKIAI